MRLSALLALMLGVCLVVAPLLHGRVARAAEADEAEVAEAGEDEEAEDGADEYGDEEDFSEEDVLVMTKENFDSTISSKEFVLVEFYAPWCGHCKSLAPEYAAAATELKEVKPNVVLAKVDATEHTELAERFGVQGYPTLKWFVNGTASEYTGGRDEDAIIRWIRKSTGPVAEEVSTVEELKQHEAAKGAVLVLGYFKAFDKADETYASFVDAALGVDGTVLQTSSADVAKAAGDMPLGSVSLIMTGEGGERKVVPYKGSLADAADLAVFAIVETLPLTLPFNADNSERIFNSKISRHMILVAKPADLKPESPVFQAFEGASKALRDERKFVFVSVDVEDEEGEPVTEFFGVDKSKVPLVIGFEVEPTQQKFWYKGDLTTDELVKWGKGIVDGSVEAEFQSEEVPSPDTVDGVKIVVGKTFTEVTTDPTKDVLVEIYAPWCGHCQELEPIYKALAARFKDIDSVVIAKLDGTVNEHKDLNVEGYPTLLFFPAAENAEVIEFEEGRELEAMTKFISDNAKSKFELPASAAPEKAHAEDAPEVEAKKDEL